MSDWRTPERARRLRLLGDLHAAWSSEFGDETPVPESDYADASLHHLDLAGTHDGDFLDSLYAAGLFVPPAV